MEQCGCDMGLVLRETRRNAGGGNVVPASQAITPHVRRQAAGANTALVNS